MADHIIDAGLGVYECMCEQYECCVRTLTEGPVAPVAPLLPSGPGAPWRQRQINCYNDWVLWSESLDVLSVSDM